MESVAAGIDYVAAGMNSVAAGIDYVAVGMNSVAGKKKWRRRQK
jgi:hypothetical protein